LPGSIVQAPVDTRCLYSFNSGKRFLLGLCRETKNEDRNEQYATLSSQEHSVGLGAKIIEAGIV
jgi:hypothetical protein